MPIVSIRRAGLREVESPESSAEPALWRGSGGRAWCAAYIEKGSRTSGWSALSKALVEALRLGATIVSGGRTFWVPESHHAHLFEVWGSPDGTGAS